MTGAIRSAQSDLFTVPVTTPPLPAVMRAELVSLISALLLEVTSHKQETLTTASQEADREQQDHA